MERLWVAQLNISPRTAAKIVQLHGLMEWEVRDAVVCVAGLRYVWHDHPDRGRRALVEVYLRSRRTVIVLYPSSDPMGDVYNLGSAYFDDP